MDVDTPVPEARLIAAEAHASEGGGAGHNRVIERSACGLVGVVCNNRSPMSKEDLRVGVNRVCAVEVEASP